MSALVAIPSQKQRLPPLRTHPMALIRTESSVHTATSIDYTTERFFALGSSVSSG